MAETTGISWTDHTQNFWLGCTEVSPACARCYAKALVNGRMGGDFDQRRRTVPANWRKPFTWDKAAERAGIRRRVFSLSLGDFFDNQVPPEWRDDAWAVIRATPNLDWQLLTKRPSNIVKMLPPDWGDGYPNVWLGTTVENQAEADRRIPHLLAVPAAVRFLSCEPLLEPVNLHDPVCRETGSSSDCCQCFGLLDWVIIGGESGPGARPMRQEWARDLIGQCRSAGVPVWFKQTGNAREDWQGVTGKGDDPAQWLAEFRVQEMPA